MPRSIKCPHCSRALKVADSDVGKQLTCGGCKKSFVAAAPHGTSVTPTGKGTSVAAPANGTAAARGKSTAVAPAGKGTAVAHRAKAAPAAPAAKAKYPRKSSEIPSDTLAAAPQPKPAMPPPVPATGRPWHLHVDGHNQGPYAAATVLDQVRTGRILPDTLAWKEGMADWAPLSEIAEFRTAVGTAIRAHPKGAAAKERDERARRYAPGRDSRRERAIALWVSGGLGLAALVTLLVVLSNKSKPEMQPVAPKAPPQTIIISSSDNPFVNPSPATKSGEKTAPSQPKGPHAGLTNDQLFARFTKELAEGFQKAIEAHKNAKRRPILVLAKLCTTWAEELKTRQWGGYQIDMDSLVEQLTQAGDSIKNETNERTQTWDLGEGLDDKKRAEMLELNKMDWITNRQKLLDEYIGKLTKRGLAPQ